MAPGTGARFGRRTTITWYSPRISRMDTRSCGREPTHRPPVRLLEDRDFTNPSSLSSDGRILAHTRGDSGIELVRLDLSDPEHPKVTGRQTWLSEGRNAVFSPDDRWIAYVSQESGRPEVYVRPAPQNGAGSIAKWTVSTSGGVAACWSRDGRRLFYSTPDNFVMVVDYAVSGARFRPGAPRRWSDSPIRDPRPSMSRRTASESLRSSQPRRPATAEFAFHIRVQLL